LNIVELECYFLRFCFDRFPAEKYNLIVGIMEENQNLKLTIFVAVEYRFSIIDNGKDL